MEAILSRHSTRRFISKPIPEETLLKLVHAGMSAPSAMNSSPWHFIIVSDRNKLDGAANIHPYAKMSSQAAAGILVCGELKKETFKEFFDQNCSAATENILIAATALNIGSVWVGIHPNEAYKKSFAEYFSLPKEIIPFAWIPLGFKEGPFIPDNRFDSSKVHNNVWQKVTS